MNVKTIKIKFSGIWGNFNENDNFIINILRKHYNVILSENPEYLFYSVFSKDFLKYDCVRIFYTGENLCPDFNVCDYGIGFNYMEFGDRYLRFPQYLVSDYSYYLNDNYRNDLMLARKKHLITSEEIEKKTAFCSFVYSNSDADLFREKFYIALSKYKEIASGGRFRNNIGGPVEDKLKFQLNFKFSIAFENSATPGYTTEKILQAFAAKTIPIYWGNPEIGKEFNEKAFINCHLFNSIDDIIDTIIEIDNDDIKYKEMLLEPSFYQEYSIEKTYNDLEAFLVNIFEQDYEGAYRRNRCYWGKRYERKQKIGSQWYWFLRKFIKLRDICNNAVSKLRRGSCNE
jgi:hypothetical protein